VKIIGNGNKRWIDNCQFILFNSIDQIFFISGNSCTLSGKSAVFGKPSFSLYWILLALKSLLDMLGTLYFVLYEFFKFVCPLRIFHDIEEMEAQQDLNGDIWYEI